MKKETGTTTIGLKCKDGVILATESRASMGYLVASKNMRKVFKIDDNIGITTAGSAGDIQAIVRLLRAETNIFKYQKQKKLTTKALTNLLSNILQGNKMFPYLGQFIIGGVDEEPRIASLDPTGGVTDEDNYYSAGSGSLMAYGVLEDRYKESIPGIEEGKKIAVKAIRSARQRDIASGNDIVLVVLDKKGYHEVPKEEIEKILKSVAS